MEYLFTEENLKKILAPLKRSPGKRGSCPVCDRLSGIMNNGKVSGIDAEDAPGLEEFILIKNSWHILRCPLCSRLYTDEYRYDHLVGGSEDEYRIASIDYNEALDLLKGIKAKKLTKAGKTWIVSF